MSRLTALAVAIVFVVPLHLKGALADTARLPVAWLETLPSTTDFRYVHHVQSRTVFEQILERIMEFVRNVLSQAANTDGGVVAFVLGMVVLVVVVIVLTRRSGGVPWRVGGARTVIAGGSTVEDLTEEDLDRRVGEAEQAGDYRAAVRYHFLQILRELQDAGFIEWRAERTNREYYRALASTPLAQTFADVLMVFERVWYGEHGISSDEYTTVASRFAGLRATIRKQS
jgi:hypothetical protein